MAAALVLANGSAVADPIQWTSVDNLVNASGSISATLNAAIKRVGGTEAQVGGGAVTPNGYLEVDAVLLKAAQIDDYNAALLEVQNDIFSKTAAEYFGEQYSLSQAAFAATVDQFVAAVTPIATAQHINSMASQVQFSGDAVEGQQLQQFINNNPGVFMTTENMTMFNDSLTVMQDAADTFAAVAAVYNDQQLIDNFQFNADANGVDFLNADNVFLDRIENQAFTGYDAAVVVDFTSVASLMLIQDISTNIQTTEFLNQAGANTDFYTTGPTQNTETTCNIVFNGGLQTWQTTDPDMPCYIEPAP
jgi:hypothetical protein